MTLIEAISEAVTAKQAAELYGLKFDRRGLKAVCPWHNDHKPSLSFKGKRCKCFSCNNGGDAVDLTAQILGIPLMDAAKRLQSDFGIGVKVDRVNIAELRAKQRAAERAKIADEKRHTQLCAIERECREKLATFDKETAWDDPEFERILKLFAVTQDTLNGWDA